MLLCCGAYKNFNSANQFGASSKKRVLTATIGEGNQQKMNSTRIFGIKNIQSFIDRYEESFIDVGHTIEGLRGRELIEALKRKKLGHGPYPGVVLFEAANRIMSDLVILHGVKSLLIDKAFPFDEFRVELGHENNNAFDIMASNGSEELIGEAFNVSQSFFAVKKNAALRKLRASLTPPDFTILMFNHEAVPSSYSPRQRENEFFVMVDTRMSTSRIVPLRHCSGQAVECGVIDRSAPKKDNF